MSPCVLTGRQKLFGLGLGFLLLPTLSSLPIQQQGVPTSVVAHWRLQGGVKGTVATQARVIEDSSRNDQHGIPIANPRFVRTPIRGSNLALVFASDHQRVFVPDDVAFWLDKSLTLEAYVRVDRYPARTDLSCMIHRGDARPGFDPWWLSVRRSGQLSFGIFDARNAGSVLNSSEPLPIGKWVHVAGVLDHESGMQRLFIEGREVAQRETGIRAAKVLGGRDGGIGIGNLPTPSPQAFRGAIAEVRICSEALGPGALLPPVDR